MDKRTPTPPTEVNRNPSTPQRVLDIVANAELQSTPSNRGSASASEHLTSVLVDDVSPSILADIKNHRTCTVEALLNHLLSLSLPEEQKRNPPADLLDQCIDAVLPICNAHDHQLTSKGKQIQVDEETLADAMGLRTYLTEYCESQRLEVAGYRPFVLAFNHALRALHNIDVPLRKSTDLRLLFHRNDPKLITATHNGHQSKRKPDIVLVSLDAAQHAFSEGDLGGWSDHALKTAAEPPNSDFKWSNCLSAGELRRIKPTLPSPPAEYTVKLPKTIPPQAVPNVSCETTEDVFTEAQLAQPPKEMIPKSVNAVQVSSELRRSGRLNSQPSDVGTTPSSGASASRKRKSELGEGSSNKKAKTKALPLKRLPAMLQTALYGVERVSDAIWISPAINLVFPVDDVAYVWYYDNEGAIQSHGINFVQDLPHFLILLLSFERFTSRDWGVIPLFKMTENDPDHRLLSFPSSPSHSAVDITIGHTDKIRDHFGIVGRATQMLSASSDSKDPRDVARSLGGMELVLKVYWPEASRVGEDQIIEKACEIAKENDHVNGHLPDLICSHDFHEYSTKPIRMALGIISKGHRVLKTMLFRRLYPITDLTGERFWKAFWQCFRCHYHLWVGGVEHNDISVKNLMYDKLNEARGILNDYDLAHLDGHPRPSGTERTGTMPFMAIDLLTDDAWAGKIKRQYRHDCESFAWVLLWICCRYDGGREISHPPLSEFITIDHNQCFKEKHSIFARLPSIPPTPSYKSVRDASVAFLSFFIKLSMDREVVVPGSDIPSEPTIVEVLQCCREVMKGQGVPIDLP